MSEVKLTFTAEDAEQKHGWLPWYAYDFSKDIQDRLQNDDLSDKEVYEFQENATKILRKTHISQMKVVEHENKAWAKYQTRREVNEKIQQLRDSGESLEAFDWDEEVEALEEKKEIESSRSLINNLLNKKNK